MARSPTASTQDHAASSDLRRRFLEFHSQIDDSEARYQSFYNTVGYDGLQQHLDGLEKLCLTSEMDKSEFAKWWCKLLKRTARFNLVKSIFLIEEQIDLQTQASRLAFGAQHPTMVNREIDHEQRIKVIDCTSYEDAVELLDTLIPRSPVTSDQETRFAVWERFSKLHPTLSNLEESYKAFRDLVELNGVQKHLDDLDRLCNELQKPSRIFARVWCSLLKRMLSFDQFLASFPIEPDDELQARVSQLAFAYQHPKISQDFKPCHEKRVEAINSRSSEEAEKLFEIFSRSGIQAEIIAEGFDHTYLDSNNILDPILKTLEQNALDWSPSEHLAPYTSLIGPTMSGKSRLLKELSRRVCVVYICVRPRTSTGYPPRSEYASEKLIDSNYQTARNTMVKPVETQHTRLLLAILHAVADYFLAQESKMDPDERLQEWIKHSFPQKYDLDDPPFWTEVRKAFEKIPNPTDADEDAKIYSAMTLVNKSTAFIRGRKLKIILAIDEARELLDGGGSTEMTFFRIFRRVLHKIPTGVGFFSLFADTASRVSNFNPPAHREPSHRNPSHRDPSHRPGKTSGAKLFPPIYEYPSFDVTVSKDPPQNWDELQLASRLLRYGCPFWGVYVDDSMTKNRPPYQTMTNLVQLALVKLLCTNQTSISADSLTDLQAIALLGSTIQLQLHGAAPINAELVSSHAAQCMYINPSREMLISEYPSQFTYSSAANQYLAHDEARLIRCIQVLAFTQRQGYIATGNIGEIVSRIILLRAMQETMKKTEPTAEACCNPKKITMPFGHSVRLVDFLETLTGAKIEDIDLGSITRQNKTKLLNEGWLFWNHFVATQYTPSSADLLENLYRGMAIQCKPNQWGFDQIFSIYLQSKQDEPLDAQRITLCGIQVKNQINPSSLKAKSHHWTPGFADIKIEAQNPYLVIHLSLRGPKSKSEPTNVREKSPPYCTPIPANPELPAADKTRRASLAFHSLDDFPFLTAGLIDALKDLLDAHPNILSLHDKSSEDAKRFVKKVSPRVYSELSPQSQKRRKSSPQVHSERSSERQKRRKTGK